jgi:putative glutathione S-transferase
MLVEGKWRSEWKPVDAVDESGGFVRQASTFRSWVTPDGAPGPSGGNGFVAEAGRYHLYVSLACPWASRTLVGRALKGLEGVISVSVVEPAVGEQGWQFGDAPGADGASLEGDRYLHQVYSRCDPHVSGRATVPVLWDKRRGAIVNNESADILRMLSTGFVRLATRETDLYPADLASDIDRFGDEIYPSLNNGVYRAGLATTQRAYAEAFCDVFAALDLVERRFSDGRAFVFGDRVTEADVRLFVTEVRFDAGYHGAFKLNLRRFADYPHLSAHLERMLALPGVRATVSVEHIKRGYYAIRTLNPGGLIPLGPKLPWDEPAKAAR